LCKFKFKNKIKNKIKNKNKNKIIRSTFNLNLNLQFEFAFFNHFSMRQLATLNHYFLKYKWHLLGGILFVVISNYFRILQPQTIRQAMDLVVDNLQMYRMMDGFDIQSEYFAELGKTTSFFGILVLLFSLLMGVFMYFMRQTIIVMSRLIEYDLRKALFGHYEILDTAFYRKNNTGDLMARITEDVSKVRMYLGPAVLYAINLIALFVQVVHAMLQVNITMTLYSLLPLPFLSLSIYLVSDLINRKSELIQRQLAKLNSVAQESYSGIRVIKSYVRESPMADHFADQSDEFKQNALSLARVNALFFPLMLFLIGLSTIITVYIGGLQVIKGNITTGNIAEFVIYVNILNWPVTSIGWIASMVQQAAASQKRINEFMSVRPEITNPSQDPVIFQGDIRFENVTLVYPDTGIKALDNVSFHVKSGEKMAVIGRTGSGKTTLAELLLRMYDVTSGTIYIDGVDIRQVNLELLRKRTGYVPQDVFLFSDTVCNNIRFGRSEASEEEVREYAGYAAIHQEIMTLPQQYDTLVGERGVTLSGGQKQRVSIARAFIKSPDMVILDDCLSAVDTTTEQSIMGYLSSALKDRTSILITHRVNHLIDFEYILVLDQGKVLEYGTHEQLLQNKGYYSDMFEQQQLN
jgi:ATP-binding cassette subfamily B multidrug efflux pump